MTASFDIIVVGNGPAGLATACFLAGDGRRVAVIGAAQSRLEDTRTVALMQPSIRLLSDAGVWTPAFEAQVAPLKRLRIVDDTGTGFHAPTVTFDPAEIGQRFFGWNIPLALLIPALEARARELGVALIAGDATAAHCSPSSIEIVALDKTYAARLAIAADGRKSVLREAAGIRCTSWNYEQTAIATSFDHSGSHDGLSTEYHRSAGPCTTVPMPGKRSSVGSPGTELEFAL